MNKKEFMDRLAQLLSGAEEQERRECEAYFSELIDDAVLEGKSEEEAVASIGTPEEAVSGIPHSVGADSCTGAVGAVVMRPGDAYRGGQG